MGVFKLGECTLFVVHAVFLDWIFRPGPWGGPYGVGKGRIEGNSVLFIRDPPGLDEICGII